ncbi:hypothetical protein H112_01587 [Trichophyton rubrum D6]|uniref:Uncharacterized protein n=3 Tax=Trichophyton TaxID=5550 RepID=A0A080WQI2_TRIRC|nr:uncharacterized protein TERG_12532 [Trichophyton rubrum CBS 118892]EZF26384.1 hypothetical protein H100_01583 [Trichophyton rubrum MR850]EZF45261.1 hypothetical protein H102_01578 [Trichophyton rubrum CBS 100081]EZF55965.1 hypothetical protein H103_01591 [Trichophyton rubrum CBS 288.86]EZF66664.1 hypothetical protein H104_01566 [Trichophyton rubrum CBS 289.86]EZF77274.1 hypothetical protein H105_01594 [Trichophyton soudanense CBS 452.61]EZF87963.1 hypothetical protein H110_01586 [Trichophy
MTVFLFTRLISIITNFPLPITSSIPFLPFCLIITLFFGLLHFFLSLATFDLYVGLLPIPNLTPSAVRFELSLSLLLRLPRSRFGQVLDFIRRAYRWNTLSRERSYVGFIAMLLYIGFANLLSPLVFFFSRPFSFFAFSFP